MASIACHLSLVQEQGTQSNRALLFNLVVYNQVENLQLMFYMTVMHYRSSHLQLVKGKVGVAAPGCFLLSVTVMWTGALVAYERKGLTWRCGHVEEPLFPRNYLNFYISCPELPRTHIHANWHAHTLGQIYQSVFIVISTVFCTYTEPERYQMHTLVVNKWMCKCTGTDLCMHKCKNMPIDTHTPFACGIQCQKMDIYVHISCYVIVVNRNHLHK